MKKATYSTCKTFKSIQISISQKKEGDSSTTLQVWKQSVLNHPFSNPKLTIYQGSNSYYDYREPPDGALLHTLPLILSSRRAVVHSSFDQSMKIKSIRSYIEFNEKMYTLVVVLFCLRHILISELFSLTFFSSADFVKLPLFRLNVLILSPYYSTQRHSCYNFSQGISQLWYHEYKKLS